MIKEKESLKGECVCQSFGTATTAFYAFFYRHLHSMQNKVMPSIWAYAFALLFCLIFASAKLTTYSKSDSRQLEALQDRQPKGVLSPLNVIDEYWIGKSNNALGANQSSIEQTNLTPTFSNKLPTLVTVGLAAMLENINSLKNLTDSKYTIASQYDLLKAYLVENPEYIEDAFLLLNAYAADSTQYRMLIAAIAGVPDSISGDLLLRAVDEFYAQGDEHSSEQLVDLIFAAPTKQVSDDVMRALIHIGLGESASLKLTLDIVTLIDPSRLALHEGQKLARQLEGHLHQASHEQVERIVPTLLNVLPLEGRTIKAYYFLSGRFSSDIKRLVLESVSAGIVPTSEELKNLLFDLVANPSDPNAEEIADILRSEFTLSEHEKSALSH